MPVKSLHSSAKAEKHYPLTAYNAVRLLSSFGTVTWLNLKFNNCKWNIHTELCTVVTENYNVLPSATIARQC